MKETELFEPIREWLEDKGWDVYSEVFQFAGIADIVGKQDPSVYCVVEMKTSLSHELIDQIIRWKSFAQYRYIAIPYRKKPLPKYLCRLLSDEGIGVLQVRENKSVVEEFPARYRKKDKRVEWQLHEGHKDYAAAGSSGGAHWTPYKQTMSIIKGFLKRELFGSQRGYKDHGGWVSIEEILDKCETHYASPKPSVRKSLTEFETDWCETKIEKGKLYYKHNGKEDTA